jgi:protein-tyrosine phosphatase
MTPLTELPFGLPGRIFRSAMPYSSYDPAGDLLELYQQEGMSVIVLLAEVGEYLAQARRDLRALYAQRGFEVIYLPISDFGVPNLSLNPTIRAVLEHARSGENIVIHCLAGIGRTGLFAACLAREALGLSGEEAIQWVRAWIPKAVETDAQRKAVLGYTAGEEG